MPISPYVGAALAMGGTSLVSNLIGGIFGNKATSNTNASNLQIARENNQTAIDIASRNNELSQQMFLRQLEYASPSEQRRMLEEAGYNPNLYALGASAPAASSPSLQQPQLNTPTLQAPLSLAQSLTQFGQSVGSLYSIAADADLKKAQSTNQKIRNDFEVGQQIASLRSAGADAEAKELANTYNHYTMSDRILNAKMTNEVLDADKRLKIANALHQEIKNQYADELSQKELAQLDKAIDLLVAQGLTETTKQELNRMGISDYISQIAYRKTKAAIERYDAETRRIVGNSQASSNFAAAENLRSQSGLNRIVASIQQRDLDYLKKHDYAKVAYELDKLRNEAEYFKRQSIGKGLENTYLYDTMENRIELIYQEAQRAIERGDWYEGQLMMSVINPFSGFTK